MRIKPFILLLLIYFSLFLPIQALAQELNNLSRVEVEFWPEYDQQSMLVIYHLDLPSAALLPARMSFRIPASVGDPNAIASRQPDGVLIDIPYELKREGDWNVLEFTATTPGIQLEYYDPGFQIDGVQRTYNYTWAGDYAVDNFEVTLQQPPTAYDMTTSPNLGSGETANDQLVYYTGEYGALESGQPFELSLNYNKDDDTLTAEGLAVNPISPVDEKSTGRMPLSIIPWILGGIGLALLGGGAIWYWQSGRRSTSTKPRPRHKPASQAPAKNDQTTTSTYSSQTQIYCHQCGRRAASGDKFCRTCGTQLRPG